MGRCVLPDGEVSLWGRNRGHPPGSWTVALVIPTGKRSSVFCSAGIAPIVGVVIAIFRLVLRGENLHQWPTLPWPAPISHHVR